ncbi:MAG: glutaminyl-peptide cyclotransferase [Fibromonadales bacterium]|nr:glutaminyl-peptide cyclotransferase [Fibromonadales bacterium]
MIVIAIAMVLALAAYADSIPHPQTRFTQGLFWDGNELWESTGLVGQSKIYRMDKKGVAFDSIAMPNSHFGEGIAKIDNKIFWLTWRSNMGFVLSANPLQALGTFKIAGEGWGLTAWRGNLLMSNGTSSLYVLSAKDMSVIDSVKTQVKYLNELEAVGDTLYANVWGSDSIAVMSLPAGKVVKWLDFSEKARSVRKSYPGAEVLNGIAWDGKNLWVTGKNWPQIYKIITILQKYP